MVENARIKTKSLQYPLGRYPELPYPMSATTARPKFAQPGSYLIVGRRDDSDQIVFSLISDVPAKPSLSVLCRRSLYEMGINDPLVYEFLCMLYILPKGGAQVVLDQNTLRRYVHAHYA